MLKLKQLISQILIIQILVSCSPNELSVVSKIPTPTVQSTDTMQINGFISQFLNSLSGLIISESVAAEGTLTLYDLSNPLSPIEIYSEDITGSDAFSVKLKRTEVSAKLIKASFTSREDLIKSRDIIFEVQGSETSVDASMNEELSLQAQVLEAQLQFEVSQGEVQLAEIKNRFRELKEEPTSDITEMLGDKSTIIKLFYDQNTKETLKEIVVQYKRAQKNSDESTKFELRRKLYEVGVSVGAVNTDEVISCNGNTGFFLFQDRIFNVFAIADQLEISKIFGKRINFDKIDSSYKANDIFIKLGSILKDVSAKYESTMSAVIYFEPVDGKPTAISSCRLYAQVTDDQKLKPQEVFPFNVDLTFFDRIDFSSISSFDEARSPLIEAYAAAIKDFYKKLEESELEKEVKNEALWNQIQITNAELAKRIKDIYISFNPSKNPESHLAFDNTFFEIIFYDQISSIDQGQSLMTEALEKSLENLRYNLKQSGLEERVQLEILTEQEQIAKVSFELRAKMLDWNYSNFRF